MKKSSVILFCSICIVLPAMILSGCSAEQDNPLAVEVMGGNTPKNESMSLILDSRGILNGKFISGEAAAGDQNLSNYPVRYLGKWSPIMAGPKSNWYMITSNSPGAVVNVVGTMTRVIFDFWDFDFYDDPGTVRFELDGNPVGNFALGRTDASGQKILEYMVVTNKTSVATVSMILQSGRTVISGYMLVFP